MRQLEHTAIRHGVVEDAPPVEGRIAAGYVLPMVLREELAENLPVVPVDGSVGVNIALAAGKSHCSADSPVKEGEVGVFQLIGRAGELMSFGVRLDEDERTGLLLIRDLAIVIAAVNVLRDGFRIRIGIRERDLVLLCIPGESGKHNDAG